MTGGAISSESYESASKTHFTLLILSGFIDLASYDSKSCYCCRFGASIEVVDLFLGSKVILL